MVREKGSAQVVRYASDQRVKQCERNFTLISVSVESARSETNRSRSKSMLAPEVMATNVWPCSMFSWAYLVTPAMPSAPGDTSVRGRCRHRDADTEMQTQRGRCRHRDAVTEVA